MKSVVFHSSVDNEMVEQLSKQLFDLQTSIMKNQEGSSDLQWTDVQWTTPMGWATDTNNTFSTSNSMSNSTSTPGSDIPSEKVGSLFGSAPCLCEDGRIYYAILDDDETEVKSITKLEYESIKIPTGWATCPGCGGANGPES